MHVVGYHDEPPHTWWQQGIRVDAVHMLVESETLEDNPPNPGAIAASGFVTLRVDKSGLGDSERPPCATIGYREELDGYRAALQALRAHPAVDPRW